jgi:hypothetical protein
MRILFIVFLIFHSATLIAQKPGFLYRGWDEEMDPKRLSTWTVKKPQGYEGVYHFGFSEGEWSMLVVATDTGLVMQAENHSWGKMNTGEETFLSHYKTYGNVKLKGNGFEAADLWGYFITYKFDDGTIGEGMILLNGKGKLDSAEFGLKGDRKFEDYFDGDYPELSYKVMDDAYFMTKSKEQLQLMRNEIFARYGLIFAKDGKAYKHFSKETWYRPWKKDVSSCITPIEEKNLQKIKAFESKQ